MSAPAVSSPSPSAARWALIWFVCCLAFHFWGVTVGWQSRNLPGQEFRQTQTALSAYFIQQDRDFSLAYPTPVLGPPWSIPMEFPLYQWTVVLTSDLTGWGLTKAGRAVSIACFYLLLPAVHLLLAWWAVAPGRRWLVLAVIVTCPFYIFYARAFLMETMALMFSAWFAVGYSRAIEGRRWRWIVVAMIAGVGAALVKVTTFVVFLLPLAWWTVARWRRLRLNLKWSSELSWIFGALILPLLAATWWTWYADTIKERNPLADFLLSRNLTEFTLGSARTRLSASYWAMKWLIVRDELTWLPLFGVSLLGFVAGRGRLVSAATLCVTVFGATLVIFPVLYALHSYYYVANLLWLLLAAGLGLVALSESGRSRVALAVAVGGICLGQAGYFLKYYYPVQSPISPGGDSVTQALRQVTRPEEVVVITGQDWSSIIPFYARRRAMMVRSDCEGKPEVVERALENLLANAKVGALLVTGSPAPHGRLIERLAQAGLSRTPVLYWRDIAVFLRTDRLNESLSALEGALAPEVRIAPGVVLPAKPPPPQFEHCGEWVDVANLPPYFQQAFDGMQPRPVRVYMQYGISVERAGGVYRFGAHPLTRLVFELPLGRHRLRTRVWFSRDAWREDLPAKDRTDGVGLRVSRVGSGHAEPILFTRHVNPVARPADRGPLALSIEFTLPKTDFVEIAIDPGPAGSSVRDWVSLDRITFERLGEK